MIPLKDYNNSKSLPFVTFILIIFNILMFVYEMRLAPSALESFFYNWGFVPARVGMDVSLGEKFFPLFSCMFLHGGLLHLLGNMWFMWIFADNVEDRMGHFGFIIFYLLCGLAAGLFHWYMQPGSRVPTVGASGAIAGVLGAYVIFFPKAKVSTLVPIVFFYWRILKIPAYIFLGIWFIYQFLMGMTESSAAVAGIAFWAHIGGFGTGLILAKFFKK
jgi:membrane associated rhomboid family serine protease